MAIASILSGFFGGDASASDAPSVGSKAPTFTTETDKGTAFDLTKDRKGKWTVLYFYPKDDTPGCTKQACAFRDSIDIIRKKEAEVYGVSQDDKASHEKFVKKYKLNFPLLADPEGKISKAYGVSGMLGFNKRWTFIVDPTLTVRWVQKNVDPALNATEVAKELGKLQDATH